MSSLSQTSAIGVGGAAVARSATDHLDAAGTHPAIVDALGQESVDQLMASLRSVVDGGAAAAEAVADCVKSDVIEAKGDELIAAGPDVTAVDESNFPESVDVEKLRAATAKVHEVTGQVDDLANAIEAILCDEQVLGRLRQEFAAHDDGADLEVVKAALAQVHPGNVPIAAVLGTAIGHVTAATGDLPSNELPSDIQEALAHLGEALKDAFEDLAGLIERLRDMAIAAVDTLA